MHTYFIAHTLLNLYAPGVSSSAGNIIHERGWAGCFGLFVTMRRSGCDVLLSMNK